MLLCPQPKLLTAYPGAYAGPVDTVREEIRESLPPEAYWLSIAPEGILLQASDPAGFFYARQTLAQIVQQSWVDGSLPCVEIEDWPDFAERGFMLDVSRTKVPTLATLRHLVDLMASLKFNQLQLYIEHTFAYAGHELVWGDSSPLTGAEIEELDVYCRERFIELVPNQNSFGHMERWLRHPEYHYLAESPDGFIHPFTDKKVRWGSTLKPDEESLAFINELYGELLPHFSSKKLHGGCDETWELGQGWSKPQTEAEGLGTVYLRHLSRISDLAEKHGKHLQYWADGVLKHPELTSEAPQRAMPVVWGYEAAHPFDEECRVCAEAELPFYVAPGDSTWNSFTGRLATAEPNIAAAARHGQRFGARGLIHTHWGDSGHPQTWAVMLPGLVLAASASWNTGASTPLAGTLSTLILRDANGTLGQALCGLGQIDTALGLQRGNRSFLFDAFFDSPEELLPRIEGLKSDAMNNLVERLESIAALIAQANPQTGDATWLLDEARLAHDMCYWALRRLLVLRRSADTADLRPTLTELIGRYETIWLRRNRPGGLHESSARLRAVLASL